MEVSDGTAASSRSHGPSSSHGSWPWRWPPAFSYSSVTRQIHPRPEPSSSSAERVVSSRYQRPRRQWYLSSSEFVSGVRQRRARGAHENPTRRRQGFDLDLRNHLPDDRSKASPDRSAIRTGRNLHPRSTSDTRKTRKPPRERGLSVAADPGFSSGPAFIGMPEDSAGG